MLTDKVVFLLYHITFLTPEVIGFTMAKSKMCFVNVEFGIRNEKIKKLLAIWKERIFMIFIYVCSCVFVYVIVCMHMYACVYIYVHMCACMYMHVCICISVYVHARVYICTCVFTYVPACTHV